MNKEIEEQNEERLLRLKLLSNRLDEVITIPGTKYKIGSDPIIGAIPIIGDLLGSIISIYILYSGSKLLCFTSALFSFDRLVPLLTKDYRVISYDFPGFGLTGAVPSRDYSFQSLLDSVSEIRKELKIEELILLGHSMGGRVAWHYAAEHPDEIEGLIIVGSGVIANDKDFIKFQENNGDPIIFDLLRADFPFKEQLLYFTPKFFAAQGAKTSIYDQALVTEELITLFHELALLDGTRLAFGDMMSQVKKNDFIDDLDLLKSIEVPTLVIHGEKDNLVNLWSVKYFEEYIDDVDVQYYSDIGHFPIYEDPQRSFKDINKFILSLK